MCTSLLYTDAHGAAYAGRTMELPMELPYAVSFYPAGTAFNSVAGGHPALTFNSTYAFISLTVPNPMTKNSVVVEGINEMGLTFSLLAFASTEGPQDMVEKTQSALAAINLGAWTLANFQTVAQVKAALQSQPVLVTALLPLGLMKTPFHYTLHDADGASIVIEFSKGQQNVIDNPLGVMTNGPEFEWHMTNLNNYTFLSNKDQSQLKLNGIEFKQPDSGIATVALPASNTSVGRFVRAVYYAQFTEKASTPEQAIVALAHAMNNFDRPRGITIDERFKSSAQDIAAPSVNGNPLYISEYTSWTALADLKQRRFFVRSYAALNYIEFHLDAFKTCTEAKTLPLKQFNGSQNDANATLLAT